MTAVMIRPGWGGDLARLTEIYNHYVVNTHITFDLEPWAPEDRRPWLAQFADTGGHRLFVADTTEGVVGYATSTRLRPKPAYDPSVETTIYVDPGATGAGVGTLLYERLLEALSAEDVHRAYAVIALPNDGSVAFHRRFGFRPVGHLSEVGYKFGRFWDTEWFERRFDGGTPPNG